MHIRAARRRRPAPSSPASPSSGRRPSPPAAGGGHRRRPPRRISRRSQSPSSSAPIAGIALQTTNISSTTVSTARMSEIVDWMLPLSSRTATASSDVPSAASDAWFAASASWSAVRLADTAARRPSRPAMFVESVATTSAAGASGRCPRIPKSRNDVSSASSVGPMAPTVVPAWATAAAVESSVPLTESAVVDASVKRVGGPVDGRREIPDRGVDLVGRAVEPAERPGERQQADHGHDDPDRPVGDQARAEPAQPLAEPDRPLGCAGFGHLRPPGDRPSRRPR